MNVSGLNSLGLQATQKQSQKPSSEKGAPSSFEDVLGKASPKPEARTREQDASRERPNQVSTQPQKSESQNTQSQKSEPQIKSSSPDEVEAQSLPGQPTAPTLNGPINDRILSGAPAEPALVPPGMKQKAILPQEEGVDSLTRRVVWNDFLRKMKDELGVSAEDVLVAFASLSDEELAQPPQATADKVVAALGLSDQQATLAKNYFTELVSKTHSRSMGEELETSHRQINLTLMSQREAQRKSLSRTLDQMNQNFFMKNPQMAQPVAQPVTQPVTQQSAAQMISQDQKASVAPLKNMEMVEITAPTVSALPNTALPQATVATPAAGAGESIRPLTQKLEKAKPSEKNTVDEMIRQFLSPQAKVDPLRAGEMAASPMPAAQTTSGASAIGADSAASAAAAGSMSAGSLKGLLQDLSSSLDSEEESEFTSDASFLTAGLAGENKLGSVPGPNPEFQAELAKAAKEPMAVSDLVDKAQIMVHEGGGEMKVTLTPEGLGEVAMRVSVNEGKVQVQMITESDEAKKMIERQLGELKGQLHNNNLQLDTIKIDTATNLGKQLEQQYQDAQRQATQTAMEQFRQDTQGWRRSFFEQPSAKLYKGQGEAPRDVQAPTASSRKNINRRLDLVA